MCKKQILTIKICLTIYKYISMCNLRPQNCLKRYVTLNKYLDFQFEYNALGRAFTRDIYHRAKCFSIIFMHINTASVYCMKISNVYFPNDYAK